MTTDLTTSSANLPAGETDENSAKLVQNGTFCDIDPNYRLSNAQCRAIELALDGFRWSKIADILNLDRRTLWRWKTQNADFQQALAEVRTDRFSFAAQRCQTLAHRATSVLSDFLQDEKDNNRMRAAQLLLQAAARFKPMEPRRTNPDYPDSLITPPPEDDEPEPLLEPKVG